MDHTVFMPHGYCYLWKPSVLWLNVISDALIVLAYFSIPILLIYLVNKSKGRLPFNWLILLFSLFIMACGTTHLMEIINVWNTKYVLAGVIKALTGIISIITAISLIPVLPSIIKLLGKATSE
jgi:hypothetical protein